MAVNQVFNGVTYPIPTAGDLKWGPPLTRYLVALGSSALSPAGGIFTLTADVNFGTSFGLLATYYKSSSSNIAGTGILRLANTDTVGWRNFANSADLLLGVNASNALTFNGVPIGATAALTLNHILVGNASNQPTDVAMSGDVGIVASGLTTIQSGAITDSKVNASAAIALTKLASTTAYDWYVANGSGVLTPLAVTPSAAVATDSNGSPVASSTTATELGYVHGVTSGIQAQINAATASTAPTGSITMYGASSAPTGWHLCDGSAISRTTFSALFAIIGTNYGPGDGSTTFNVPNMVNNVPIGAGSTASLGATAGSNTVTPVDSGHTHPIPHAHTTVVGDNGSGSTAYMRDDNPYGTVSASATGQSFTTSAFGATSLPYFKTSGTDTANSGSGTANIGSVSVIQPSLGVSFIIKT
jgi:microcystin-dependent protein